MPYVLSRARRDLEGELGSIVRRLRNPSVSKMPPELRELVLAAAIFLAHAELENYMGDVVSDLAALYTGACSRGSTLPAKLRAHLFLERSHIASLISARLGGGDEQTLLQRVSSFLNGSAGSVVNDGVALATIAGSEIISDYGYPSFKNIERVLRRIGVGDPRGALNSAVQANAVRALETIASLRTSLAHTATLPGISLQDVIARINGLKLFVRAFDKVLYNNVCTLLASTTWRSAMR